MTNSELFTKAHAMTRATIKAGDSYQVTFGACLKTLKTQQTEPKVNVAEVVANAFESLFVMLLVAVVVVLAGAAVSSIFGASAIVGAIVGAVISAILAVVVVAEEVRYAIR